MYFVGLEFSTISERSLLHREVAFGVKPLKELAEVGEKLHRLVSLTKAMSVLITDGNEVFHTILVVVDGGTNPNAYRMILMGHLVNR